MLFLNQRKRKNGRRNIFMTKSSREDVPDARIERGANDIATVRAIAPITTVLECCKTRNLQVDSALLYNFTNTNVGISEERQNEERYVQNRACLLSKQYNGLSYLEFMPGN